MFSSEHDGRLHLGGIAEQNTPGIQRGDSINDRIRNDVIIYITKIAEGETIPYKIIKNNTKYLFKTNHEKF